MPLKRKILQSAKRYICAQDGNIAVMTAFLGLPLLMVAGFAVDYNTAYSHQDGLSSAIDTAVLASVIPANLDDEARKAYAQEVFDNNYLDGLPVKLDIKATRERVDIIATASVDSLMGGVIGKGTIDVQESAAAILTTSDVICVLALDPTGDRAIEFLDDAKFSSPECSVQANSTSTIAINSQIVTPPIAKSFCTTGLSRGKFNPFIKHTCTPIEDPYANLVPPPDGPCVDITLYGGNGGRIASETVLPPGTYCGSLAMDGTGITLLPGTYIMKDKSLWIKNGAEVSGDGVTIVFKGQNAIVEIESGSEVDLKGPADGPYKGLVFYQTKEGLRSTQQFPSATSTIIGGGSLKLTGTAYFPTQELIITSDSPVAAQAPATALIAYRLKFGGESNTEIHVDHETAGLPPLLPRSDEGARLVSYQEPAEPEEYDD
jgi:hypothetical protein